MVTARSLEYSMQDDEEVGMNMSQVHKIFCDDRNSEILLPQVLIFDKISSTCPMSLCSPHTVFCV